MSGGSFDYICWKNINDLFQYEEQIQDMSDYLARLGYARDAARETQEFLLEFRSFKNRMETKHERLTPIWKAVEWWVSGDSGEDSFKEALQKYRNETIL